MSLYSDLLFLHGHIADTPLARELSASQASDPGPATGPITARTNTTNIPSARREPMTLFKSLLYLGGLESIDSRIGEEEESFGPTYGNRVASERAFGTRATTAFHRRVTPVARRDANVGDSMPIDSKPIDSVGCIAGGCG